MKRPGMMIAALAALAAGTAACATTSETASSDPAVYLADARLGNKVDKVCFKASINDFRAPTASTVIIEKGVKDYLVQTVDACNQLDGAQSIAFDNFETSGCVSEADYISASYSRLGADNSAPSSRCRIAAIYEWNEEAQVAAIE